MGKQAFSVKVYLDNQYQEASLSAHACVEYRPFYEPLARCYVLQVYADDTFLGWHWANGLGIVSFAGHSEALRYAILLTAQVMRALASLGRRSVVPGPLTRQTPNAPGRSHDAQRLMLAYEVPFGGPSGCDGWPLDM